MKIKDKRISGEMTVNLLEPLMVIAMMISVGLLTLYSTVMDTQKINKISNEVDIFFKQIVVGEIKDNYLVKKVNSSEFCSALIMKQKDWWNSIEVENKLVDTSKKVEIYKACLLDKDEINIKFSNPILKKPL